MATANPVRCLTIAGSDSGGGAGIQADLKTFAALGTHGMSAITAITAQDTKNVLATQMVEPDVIERQIRCVLDDIGANVIKVGMLGSAENTLKDYPDIGIVLDPVMLAKGGQSLLQRGEDDAVNALINELIPLVHLVTPNLPEAFVLAGEERKIDSIEAAREFALFLKQRLKCSAVLLKGGHTEVPDQGTVVDILCDGDEENQILEFCADRIMTENTHGTGCTLAAAIAVFLGRGFPLRKAIAEAKAYLQCAIVNSIKIGRGHGCLHHMWQNGAMIQQGLPSESFCDLLWRKTNADKILQKILHHPFMKQLASGELDVATFRRFVEQDTLYLRHFGRGLALIGARAHGSEMSSDVQRTATLVSLCTFAKEIVETELQMHSEWLQEWQSSKLSEEHMTPTCMLYASYLISTAYDRPADEAAVAFLPCFWIYYRVGHELSKRGSPNPTYQRWINQYSSEEFLKSLNQMKAIVDEMCRSQGQVFPPGPQMERLALHFKRTCQMELMFWDAACEDESWPS